MRGNWKKYLPEDRGKFKSNRSAPGLCTCCKVREIALRLQFKGKKGWNFERPVLYSTMTVKCGKFSTFHIKIKEEMKKNEVYR